MPDEEVITAMKRLKKSAKLLLLRATTAYYKARYRGKATFGTGVKVHGRLLIEGPGRVEIGDGVAFDVSWQQPTRISTLGSDTTVTIGAGCYINGMEVVAADDVVIGPGCIIGDALIMTTDFHSTARDRRDPHAVVRRGPVTIGANVWLARRTTVLRAVTIGEDSVIALGTVVSADVPAGSVVAGSQQRVVRRVAASSTVHGDNAAPRAVTDVQDEAMSRR
jgi:acetyltransferase-like isoleucine patch superfamily enzyme